MGEEMAGNQGASDQNSIAIERVEEAQRLAATELNLSDLPGLDQLPYLGGLTELRTLNLEGSKIYDLRPLSELFALERLYLAKTQVEDLSPLSNLHSLRNLVLERTNIHDLRPLSNLTALIDLNLANTRIKNISPLTGLTQLRTLDLGKTDITDISPLLPLTNLTTLNLWGLYVSDYSPLTSLTSLQKVTLWDTNFTDLSLLKGLKELEYLDLDGTKISDLSLVAKLTQLCSLYVSDTNVADLRPLTKLSKLMVLGCERSRVVDLAPLARLDELFALRLAGTNVSNLSPLANLRKLKILDVGHTQVADLTPIAESIVLPERRSQGLEFGGSLIADPILLDLGRKNNPERTIEVINYLRRQQGLPQPKPELESALPGLPEQGPGPHFVLSDEGIVSFAPLEAIDSQGNNVAHLEALHPALRESARSLVEALGRGNVPHATVLERAESYLSLIDKDLHLVPFARLYVEGVRLQNAAAATNEKINEGELPAFGIAAREALDSVSRLHGSFMLSTADGLALMAAEERYERRPQEERELRDAVVAFAEELQGRPDIIDSKAADFILKAAEEMGRGTNAERSAVIATGTTKNAAIVVAAGATIGALPVVGGLLAGPAGLVGGGLVALVGVEGLKKAKSFIAVSHIVTKGLDQLTAEDLQGLLNKKARNLAPYVAFVLKMEPALRRLTNDRRQFEWLSTLLNWLVKHAKPDDKTP